MAAPWLAPYPSQASAFVDIAYGCMEARATVTRQPGMLRLTREVPYKLWRDVTIQAVLDLA